MRRHFTFDATGEIILIKTISRAQGVYCEMLGLSGLTRHSRQSESED